MLKTTLIATFALSMAIVLLSASARADRTMDVAPTEPAAVEQVEPAASAAL